MGKVVIPVANAVGNECIEQHEGLEGSKGGNIS